MKLGKNATSRIETSSTNTPRSRLNRRRSHPQSVMRKRHRPANRSSAEILLNVGCGATPIRGWTNIDNSPTLWVGQLLSIVGLSRVTNWLSPERRTLAQLAAAGRVERGKATYLPFPHESVAAIYSSHMIEHMTIEEVDKFLQECYRVMQIGACIRLCLPDMYSIINSNVNSVEEYLMFQKLGVSILGRNTNDILKLIGVGNRGHKWFCSPSFVLRRLHAHGFSAPVQLPPGETRLYGRNKPNLFERYPGSFYIEATR